MNQKTSYIVITIISLYPYTCIATPGQLDPTFGNQGITLTPISRKDQIQAMAIQSDDAIVITGFTQTLSKGLLLARFSANGALDTSFNKTGIQILSIGFLNQAQDCVLQTDGKILASGFTLQDQTDTFVSRFNTNGSLDTTFNTIGYATESINSGSTCNCIGVQSNGAIILGGSTSSDSPMCLLTRYTPQGTLDPTFGNYGIVTIAIDAISCINDIAIQPDDKIVAVGYTANASTNRIAILRFEADGSLDSSFGDYGVMTLALGDQSAIISVTLQPDGSILAVGFSIESSLYNSVILRLTPDGQLDTTFNYTGFIETLIGFGSQFLDIAVQADGNIIAGGFSIGKLATQLVLARYTSSGTLDPSFGTNGISLTTIGSNSFIDAIGLQSSGNIIAAGMSDGVVLISRFTAQ